MFVGSGVEMIDETGEMIEESLVKKRRPSWEGCVRAERSDEMW